MKKSDFFVQIRYSQKKIIVLHIYKAVKAGGWGYPDGKWGKKMLQKVNYRVRITSELEKMKSIIFFDLAYYEPTFKTLKGSNLSEPLKSGALGGVRTHNLLIRSHKLVNLISST